VAEYDPDSGLVVIEESEDQPRLGAGLSATGRLSEDAMQRAIASLERMRDTCRRHGVHRLAAVATAAVRDAENGAEFVARVHPLGISLRVISPETEAALSYRSAAHHFPGEARTLVADIGGGSLELVGARNGVVKLSCSLPLGAVRLTEQLLPLTELRDQIRRELDAAFPADWTRSMVIGSGGTFATLASVALARRGSATRAVHGVTITRAEVEQLMLWLAALPLQQRRQVPGLRPERADIIVAGLAVVLELLEGIETAGVTVSGFGLRDGLLLEMAGVV
jgi:exopolyphosphatase/guanosine-5'-triphosphate,3'-diphosphate pyrophosphatase